MIIRTDANLFMVTCWVHGPPPPDSWKSYIIVAWIRHDGAMTPYYGYARMLLTGGWMDECGKDIVPAGGTIEVRAHSRVPFKYG